MGIAQNQDVPKVKEVEQPWTFKRLFPFGGVVTSFTKVFVNPFDVLLGYLVFILGIAELFGRQVSWFMWVFATLILLADVFERLDLEETPKKTKTK